MYTEESLDNLRHSIDIISVLSEHVHLKKAGSTYKACCPFHAEKTPSFIVNPSGAYYHCFGCGEHGDAIRFLIKHLGYSFSEAVLVLAKKFQVDLVFQAKDKQTPFSTSDKEDMRNTNREAENFFRYCLHRFSEGQSALQYLYRRGVSPDAVHRFHLGYAPESSLFIQSMQERGITKEKLAQAGFLGNGWFLFARRIIFPVHDALGNTIGFSSRKFLEGTFGGKYINTPETILFKKSRTLFGLHLSRARIAKERRVILVEGQVDCLQMIEAGFNCTLSAQGTAFTEEHIRELKKLGVLKAYLLFDGDEAGVQAALRVGNMCQSMAIAATICRLPQGQDPDTFLMHKGFDCLGELLDQGEDYLTFLVSEKTRGYEQLTPVDKASLIKEMIAQIKKWEDPVLVYEHLKQLASLMAVPEQVVFSLAKLEVKSDQPAYHTQRNQNVRAVTSDMIMETDVLRCMLFAKTHHASIPYTAKHYLTGEDFKHAECRALFQAAVAHYETQDHPFSLEDALVLIQDQKVRDLLTRRRVDVENLEAIFVQSLQKIVDRRWREQKRPFLDRIKNSQDPSDPVLQEYARLLKDRVQVSLLTPENI